MCLDETLKTGRQSPSGAWRQPVKIQTDSHRLVTKAARRRVAISSDQNEAQDQCLNILRTSNLRNRSVGTRSYGYHVLPIPLGRIPRTGLIQRDLPRLDNIRTEGNHRSRLVFLDHCPCHRLCSRGDAHITKQMGIRVCRRVRRTLSKYSIAGAVIHMVFRRPGIAARGRCE